MTAKSIRVLLVKDSLPESSALIQQLKALSPGMEVIHVTRFNEALPILKTEMLDALLADLLIPVSGEFGDLWHACRALNIPIIGLTGSENGVAEDNAFRNKMHDHLVEGHANPKAILRAIHYAIQQQLHERTLRESEERFRLAMDVSRAVLYDIDAVTGQAIFVRGTSMLLGYEPIPGTMTRDWWFTQIHPDDILRVHNAWQESRNQGNDYSLEYRVLHSNGAYIIVEDKGRHLRDEAGQVIRNVGTIVDITRRKQAEAALRESERRYLDLVEELENLVEQRTADLWNLNRILEVMTDCSKAIIRAPNEEQLFNDICRIIIGVGGYQVAWIGLAPGGCRTLHTVACSGEREICTAPTHGSRRKSSDDLPAGRAIRDSMASLGCPFQSQGPNPTAQESRNQCSCGSSIALPLIVEGQTIGALTICASIPNLFDETQARVLQELADDLSFGIAVLRTRLERDRVQSDLERRSSQLRTLATELSNAEERERKRLAQAIHDDLQQLLVGAKFCSDALPGSIEKKTHPDTLQQLNEFLAKAIESTRSLTFDLSPPILHSAGLARALSYLGRQMNVKYGLDVSVRINEPADAELEEVRVLLFQATRELLFNVVKHAKVKTADVEIGKFKNDFVQIIVSDSGAGFDTSKGEESSPNGYGLYSIRGRLELIGGRLDIESAPGKGSRFTIRAPSGKQSPSDGNMWEEKPVVAAPQKPRGGLMRAGRKIRVLVADTHLMMRQRLVQSLQKHKDIAVVGEAGDGRQALVLARQVHPDVVILDVNMPLLNGVEITSRIAQELPQTKVIGLWAGKGTDKREAMQKAGASAFLSKASRLESLVTAIRKSFSGAA